MRIFDNPNHTSYGPVRRLWVVLVQLDLLDDMENHKYPFESTWDHVLVRMLEDGVAEAPAQRTILREILRRTRR